MLEWGVFILTMISTYIAYLQLERTSPRSRSSKNNKTYIPTTSILLRSIFSKYPRSIFLLPIALFGGIKFPSVAVWVSIALVVFIFINQTPSKKADAFLGGIFFISSSCIGMWLRNFDIIRNNFEEIKVFS